MVKINLSLLCNHLRRHLKCIKTDPTTSINIGMIDLCDKANFRRMKWIPIGNELQLVIIIKFNPLRWGIISHKVHSHRKIRKSYVSQESFVIFLTARASLT